MVKNLLPITLVALLSACSSNTEVVQKKNEEKLSLGTSFPTVYAKLEKQNSSYVFSEFSFNKINSNNSAWINFLTQKPLFPTSEAKCTTGSLIGEGSQDFLCKTDDSPIFRSSSVGVGDVASSTLGNAFLIGITWGIGAAAASGHYTSKFDEEAFQKALGEANNKVDKQNFLNSVQKYLDTRNDKIAEMNIEIKDIQSDIERVAKEFKLTVDNAISVKTVNKSGYSSVPLIDKNYLSTKVNYSIKVPEFEGKIPSTWKSVRQLNNKLSQDLSKYQQKLDDVQKDHLQQINVGLSCKGISSWRYDVENCLKKWEISNPVKKHKVTYNINSKPKLFLDFKDKYSDPKIKVFIENDRVNFENLTSSYLNIASFSFYVNRDVSTKSNLNIELPPFTNKVALNLNDFDNKSQLTLFNVRKKDLNKKYDLGIAVKYKVVDTDKENTLYKVKNYRASNLTDLN